MHSWVWDTFKNCFSLIMQCLIGCTAILDEQTMGLVSKETVVLHQWGSETQNFGFINWVDKLQCKLATIEKLKLMFWAWVNTWKPQLSISLQWPIYLINSVDKMQGYMNMDVTVLCLALFYILWACCACTSQCKHLREFVRIWQYLCKTLLHGLGSHNENCATNWVLT